MRSSSPDPRGSAGCPYDHLVLGVGSRDATERVPGLRSHAHSTKGDGALESLVSRLDAVVARAAATRDPIERARLLTVVVAGGGLAGVETAVAIQQRLDMLVRGRRGIVGIRPRVVLVHAGPALLPTLRPRFDRVADHAAAQVAEAGVEIWCGTRLTGVTATAAHVEGRPALPVGTVVTTLGQVPVGAVGHRVTGPRRHRSTGRRPVPEGARRLGHRGRGLGGR